MKQTESQHHGLDGLKDYTEKKSVASEQSGQILIQTKSAEILNSILELI